MKNTNPQNQPEEEYYVYPIMEGSDYRLHTPGKPFCDDMECICHQNQENLLQLSQQYQDGLVSGPDINRIYNGKTI